MLANSKLLTFLVVILFASAVVMIGAQDLKRKYSKLNDAEELRTQKLIKDLKGEPPIDKASLGRKPNAEQTEEERRDGKKGIDDLINRLSQ